MNETNLTTGPIAGSGASGDDRFMGAETGVNNELAEIGEFAKNDGGMFGEKVLG